MMEENGRMKWIKAMFESWIEARRGVVESKGFFVELESGMFQVKVEDEI